MASHLVALDTVKLVDVFAKAHNQEASTYNLRGEHSSAYNRLLLEQFFFTPIPCTYTSSLLDGMARNFYYYYYFNRPGYARSCNLSCLDPFHSYLLIPEEKKNILSELELNPGPLASQATSLTTRPWLLGLL